MVKYIEIKHNESKRRAIQMDGYFKTKMHAQLQEDDLPAESIEGIFQNASQILMNCPKPFSPESEQTTGIVIGKVQSGKTSNFISLISLAFDNGYDISIVFGGNKKILLGQNVDRIRAYFANIDNKHLIVLSTNEDSNLITSDNIKRFIQRKVKIVIVGLKHSKHIKLITDAFSDNAIAKIPTLIIDDEGDQATLNTRVFKDEMSSTYQSVLLLKEKCKKHCFLSITATPQANILISTLDLLSPDFGVLVYPGKDYCGLPQFHGKDDYKYIRVIPTDETSLLDSRGIPLSLLRAMATFFVGGAIRRYRGDSRHHAMLIHPSQKKFDHQLVINKVSNILSTWQDIAQAKLDGEDDISYNRFKIFFEVAYEDIGNTSSEIPPLDEIEILINNSIVDCSPVLICNSDNDASENAKYYDLSIFVGGNMIERGITIKGLAVTYIIRRAQGVTNVDNTEQRARWFGYKMDFLDVCRVFTTQEIKDDFANIYEHDEDLWASIERARLNGTSFKNITRIFKLASELMNLTRKNVAKTERLEYSGWYQQTILELKPDIVELNNSIISRFKETHLNNLTTLQYSNNQKHEVVKALKFKDLMKDLLDQFNLPDESRLSKDFIQKINLAFEKCSIDAEVDVVWMRPISKESRTIDERGKISELLQGSNSVPGGLNYYPGDRYIVIDNNQNRMQLQIHYVKPSNTTLDMFSPTLALQIPEFYSEKISLLVIRAEELGRQR